jgi:hypothetical protein
MAPDVVAVSGMCRIHRRRRKPHRADRGLIPLQAHRHRINMKRAELER